MWRLKHMMGMQQDHPAAAAAVQPGPLEGRTVELSCCPPAAAAVGAAAGQKPWQQQQQQHQQGGGVLQLQVRQTLAQGGNAFVYLARCTQTGRHMALKHALCGGDAEVAAAAQMEAAVLLTLQGHPNIVTVYAHSPLPSDTVSSSLVPKSAENKKMGSSGASNHGHPHAPPSKILSEVLLAMELCERGTLVSWLDARGGAPVEEKALLLAFRDVCNGVYALHCHSPPIAHRDLKAENILLCGDGATWKLCDFGSCSVQHGRIERMEDIGVQEDVIRKTTTPAYRAPELWDLFQKEVISEKVDIWALGCLLYRMAFQRSCFDGESKLAVLNGRYTIPEGHPYSTLLLQLIRDMLQQQPALRPDIVQIWHRVNQMLPPECRRPGPDHPPKLPPPSRAPTTAKAATPSSSSSPAAAAAAAVTQPSSASSSPSPLQSGHQRGSSGGHSHSSGRHSNSGGGGSSSSGHASQYAYSSPPANAASSSASAPASPTPAAAASWQNQQHHHHHHHPQQQQQQQQQQQHGFHDPKGSPPPAGMFWANFDNFPAADATSAAGASNATRQAPEANTGQGNKTSTEAAAAAAAAASAGVAPTATATETGAYVCSWSKPGGAPWASQSGSGSSSATASSSNSASAATTTSSRSSSNSVKERRASEVETQRVQQKQQQQQPSQQQPSSDGQTVNTGNSRGVTQKAGSGAAAATAAAATSSDGSGLRVEVERLRAELKAVRMEKAELQTAYEKLSFVVKAQERELAELRAIAAAATAASGAAAAAAVDRGQSRTVSQGSSQTKERARTDGEGARSTSRSNGQGRSDRRMEQQAQGNVQDHRQTSAGRGASAVPAATASLTGTGTGGGAKDTIHLRLEDIGPMMQVADDLSGATPVEGSMPHSRSRSSSTPSASGHSGAGASSSRAATTVSGTGKSTAQQRQSAHAVQWAGFPDESNSFKASKSSTPAPSGWANF